MKIDAKALAQAHARQKMNRELGKEGGESIKEQENMGDNIKHMLSFIESVHSKDPEAAHEHMMNYAKSVHEKPSSPQERE